MNQDEQTHLSPISPIVAIGAEFFLGLIGILIIASRKVPLSNIFSFEIKSLILGLSSAIPLISVGLIVLEQKWWISKKLKQFMIEVIMPHFAGWKIYQFVILCLIAGFSEETLFRGAMQGWLAEKIGSISAILIIGVIFGLAHALTLWYAIVATATGWYLGWLMESSGNIVIPALAHGIYNMVILLRFHKISSHRHS